MDNDEAPAFKTDMDEYPTEKVCFIIPLWTRFCALRLLHVHRAFAAIPLMKISCVFCLADSATGCPGEDGLGDTMPEEIKSLQGFTTP